MRKRQNNNAKTANKQIESCITSSRREKVVFLRGVRLGEKPKQQQEGITMTQHMTNA